MTAAQIYSINNQSKHCIQVLHKVARHAASWVQADGPERVPVSFLSSSVTSNFCLVGLLQPSFKLNFSANGNRLPEPVGCRCLLGA